MADMLLNIKNSNWYLFYAIIFEGLSSILKHTLFPSFMLPCDWYFIKIFRYRENSCFVQTTQHLLSPFLPCPLFWTYFFRWRLQSFSKAIWMMYLCMILFLTFRDRRPIWTLGGSFLTPDFKLGTWDKVTNKKLKSVCSLIFVRLFCIAGHINQ